jgi:GxxExxY protein
LGEDDEQGPVQLEAELSQISHQVIGAAMEVHRVLGPGFLESVYEEALSTELHLRGVPFERQVPAPVLYKGKVVGEGRLDMVVRDTVIVELKTVEALAQIHTAQLLSYLKATGYQLGLLINFNVPVLRHGIKRIINTRHKQ